MQELAFSSENQPNACKSMVCDANEIIL